MEYTRSSSDIFVRLDPGEEVHASLKRLAEDLGIDAAAITSGIGRTRNNQYGYMNEEGVYQRRFLNQPAELVSLSGNIARTEQGEPFTHIHCCWSDDDNLNVLFKRKFLLDTLGKISSENRCSSIINFSIIDDNT